jgi:hypothetical protein
VNYKHPFNPGFGTKIVSEDYLSLLIDNLFKDLKTCADHFQMTLPKRTLLAENSEEHVTGDIRPFIETLADSIKRTKSDMLPTIELGRVNNLLERFNRHVFGKRVGEESNVRNKNLDSLRNVIGELREAILKKL